MRQFRRVMTAAVLGTLATLTAACGGSGDASEADTSGAAEFTPRSIEFPLPRRSDIGTKDAHVTFTSRSDGKTVAAVDFYVPRMPGTRGRVYPVSVQQGDCSLPRETTISLGELSAGVTVVLLDESFEAAVEPIRGGSSSIVIMKPDKKTIAWCGPGS